MAQSSLWGGREGCCFISTRKDHVRIGKSREGLFDQILQIKYLQVSISCLRGTSEGSKSEDEVLLLGHKQIALPDRVHAQLAGGAIYAT